MNHPGLSYRPSLLPLVIACAYVLLDAPTTRVHAAKAEAFVVEETTIARIHDAILAGELTSTRLVHLYLERIKAFNGTAVEEPEGILGPIVPKPHAGGLNALITLNLRPAAREQWGFDERKARSMTDPLDADPAMPDALEVAAELDAEFARTGRLVGPLHGIVFAIKDQYDTFDMRTTAAADTDYADDRPPADAEIVKRLRDAGAIILAKSNMGEFATDFRSGFGGTPVNAYDTERIPGGSSNGSSTAVAANLVTVAISEESGPSIRAPAHFANIVGVSPTQELVSRTGMINPGLHTRGGPAARTVEDAARVLSVIAGYDPQDELTAFTLGRMPERPYETYTGRSTLEGVRIGVVREYMDPAVFSGPLYANIPIVDRAIEDLKKLGATTVEPPAEGLFTEYIRRHAAALLGSAWTRKHPELFPVGPDGAPASDEVMRLVALTLDPSQISEVVTMRELGAARTVGEGKFGYNLYLGRRGDARIRTFDDMIAHTRFFVDAFERNKRATLEGTNRPRILDSEARLHRRFVVQQIVLQCMAELDLDAVVYPTGLIPPRKINTPRDPDFNGIGNYGVWTFLGQQGFPAITVPAGFTTEVWDRPLDPSATLPTDRSQWGQMEGKPPLPTILVGPTKAALPTGIDFLGRPFSEHTLLAIAAAYEAATRHRRQPPDFGPLKR
ncbi:hypothetical protein ASA1KI_20450 [Opitutales bacterium ASA1]|uniref:amidase n=1 Tax=Congregicoccus parvus TaxID=3081749 RepID=UPI002B293B7A|nr:hypothetical protein ASA1KI_20450 [Opitutales bacterium ASA1]